MYRVRAAAVHHLTAPCSLAVSTSTRMFHQQHHPKRSNTNRQWHNPRKHQQHNAQQHQSHQRHYQHHRQEQPRTQQQSHHQRRHHHHHHHQSRHSGQDDVSTVIHKLPNLPSKDMKAALRLIIQQGSDQEVRQSVMTVLAQKKHVDSIATDHQLLVRVLGSLNGAPQMWKQVLQLWAHPQRQPESSEHLVSNTKAVKTVLFAMSAATLQWSKMLELYEQWMTAVVTSEGRQTELLAQAPELSDTCVKELLKAKQWRYALALTQQMARNQHIPQLTGWVMNQLVEKGAWVSAIQLAELLKSTHIYLPQQKYAASNGLSNLIGALERHGNKDAAKTTALWATKIPWFQFDMHATDAIIDAHDLSTPAHLTVLLSQFYGSKVDELLTRRLIACLGKVSLKEKKMESDAPRPSVSWKTTLWAVSQVTKDNEACRDELMGRFLSCSAVPWDIALKIVATELAGSEVSSPTPGVNRLLVKAMKAANRGKNDEIIKKLRTFMHRLNRTDQADLLLQTVKNPSNWENALSAAAVEFHSVDALGAASIASKCLVTANTAQAPDVVTQRIVQVMQKHRLRPLTEALLLYPPEDVRTALRMSLVDGKTAFYVAKTASWEQAAVICGGYLGVESEAPQFQDDKGCYGVVTALARNFARHGQWKSLLRLHNVFVPPVLARHSLSDLPHILLHRAVSDMVINTSRILTKEGYDTTAIKVLESYVRVNSPDKGLSLHPTLMMGSDLVGDTMCSSHMALLIARGFLKNNGADFKPPTVPWLLRFCTTTPTRTEACWRASLEAFSLHVEKWPTLEGFLGASTYVALMKAIMRVEKVELVPPLLELLPKNKEFKEHRATLGRIFAEECVKYSSIEKASKVVSCFGEREAVEISAAMVGKPAETMSPSDGRSVEAFLDRMESLPADAVDRPSSSKKAYSFRKRRKRDVSMEW